ncbi:MAG: peptidoglycan editing factor PgeF [Clostridia bacterium]|nr:peptidoglycan editing factor PgeF [Clostridia bacterium]
MIKTNSIIKLIRGENIDYIQFNKLLDLGVKHAFTLRKGELNFSHKNIEKEKENYMILADELNLDYKEITKPKQNHTKNVRIIDKPYTTEDLLETDGLITNKKGVVLASTSADCILYLVYDKKKKIIGNIHSGWRGTYQRIIENSIEKMIEEFGSNPADIVICSCPSIRGCHFEVDEDVKIKFEEKFKFLNLDFIKKGRIVEGKQKYNIDTIKLNTRLLTDLGLVVENIIDSGVCTVCNKDKCNSYRVDGQKFKLSTAVITLD